MRTVRTRTETNNLWNKSSLPQSSYARRKQTVECGVSHGLTSLVDVHIDTGWLDNLKLLDVLPLCRCIRPNELKSPDQFQTDKVLVQLRYTGVLETTRIRKEVWECVRRNVCVCVCVCVCGVGFCLLTELYTSIRVSLTESSLKTLFRG